jgi:hypothetical protein
MNPCGGVHAFYLEIAAALKDHLPTQSRDGVEQSRENNPRKWLPNS